MGFEDAGAGTVTLTIENTGLVEDEHVALLYFNLDPSLDASALTFDNFTIGSGSMDEPTFSLAGDNNVAGSGFYDLLLSFTTSNAGQGAKRFGAGESFSVDLAGIPSLQAESFAYLSDGHADNGHAYVATHVLAIGGEESGWLGARLIPEPGLATAGLALAALGLRRRR